MMHAIFLPGLVEQASHHLTITKVLADAAYDSKNNFSYLYNNGIIPAIKVRPNSSGRSSEYYPRKVSVISQLGNMQYWKDSVSYGKCWMVEPFFCAQKDI